VINLMVVRIALLVTGLLVWGYGARVDDSRLRLIGIGLLAIALVLRFFRRRPAAARE
jgi:hypothetical protein